MITCAASSRGARATGVDPDPAMLNTLSSRPRSGCVAEIPFFARRTCSRAAVKSTCSHRRQTSSDTRRPCR
ncbi:hypothetical protein [Methylacidiphilum caldifontis]|uniref:hypothetical protein n=1 Tax=Methylacidiphilum caldifontis TaxID=2795386 RepID=UPI0036F1AB6A